MKVFVLLLGTESFLSRLPLKPGHVWSVNVSLGVRNLTGNSDLGCSTDTHCPLGSVVLMITDSVRFQIWITESFDKLEPDELLPVLG